jgi:hypothetical protein
LAERSAQSVFSPGNNMGIGLSPALIVENSGPVQ